MQRNGSTWFDDLISRLKTNSRFNCSFTVGAGAGEGIDTSSRLSTALRAHAQEGDNQARCARTSKDSIDRAPRARTSDAHGVLILAIAGGPDWGDGRAPSSGVGVAARQARRLADTLGQVPSQTSLEEAAGAAAHAIACGLSDPLIVRYLRRVNLAPDWATLPDDVWLWQGFRHWARRTGARAAFKALRRTASGGTTGEHAESEAKICSLDTITPDNAALAVAHDLHNAQELENEKRERVTAVARWIWETLVDSLPDRPGAGAAQAQRTARTRARFLIRLTMGATLPDAAQLAGFASANAALESIRSGKVMAQLKAAAGRDWAKLPEFRELRARARVAGQRAGKAVRNFRQVASLNTKSRLARAIVNKAIAERETAVDQAKFAVARLADSIARQNEAWERAKKGWRAGWLQTDKAK